MGPLPFQSLHNDVGELHKSAVSLSRLSIRNYVLDLSPNSLLFFFLQHTAAEPPKCIFSSPVLSQRNPALIADLINEAIDECKY